MPEKLPVVRTETTEGCALCEMGGDTCWCPAEGIIDLAARKWTLHIIASLGNHGRLRFNKLKGHLGKVSPNTLAERLRELEEAGLVLREAFPEIPPRVEYRLTRHGEGLKEAIRPLMTWAGGT